MAEGYLGEFPVSIPDSIYAHWTRETWALNFIERYGQIDGEHHKTWVLDQVARILLGTPVTVVEARWNNHPPEYRVSTGAPSPAYKQWVAEMRGPVEYDDMAVNGEMSGAFSYDYDVGIAP